jgi:hypothetical protein
MKKMNFEIHFKENIKIPINFSINGVKTTIDVDNNSCQLTYLPDYKKFNVIKMSTNNNNIKKFPITIKKIKFDDFWVFENNKILFLPVTKDPSVEKTSTHNTLFFKGSLVYKFFHPFYKNCLEIH